MSILTTPRIPGSSAPLPCVDCDRPTYDNHLDQYCTDCLIEIIRDSVEGAEMLLKEAVALADLTDQVPTDLEERIAALRGAK